MAKRCEICGKGPVAGQSRSFSNKANKRWFKPNIIKKKIEIAEGIKVVVKVCAKCYKKMRAEGVI